MCFASAVLFLVSYLLKEHSSRTNLQDVALALCVPQSSYVALRVTAFVFCESLLKNTSITRIVVEHKDRLTRFGFRYLETLLETQGRMIEVVNVAENDKEDLIADLVLNFDTMSLPRLDQLTAEYYLNTQGGLVTLLAQQFGLSSDVALSIIGADRVMRLDADEVDLAIRYARSAPRGASSEIFRDRFCPVCSPKLLAERPTIRRAADLSAYPLIHFDWFANDGTAPNWERWFEMASGSDPSTRQAYRIALSFREELHAIEAVLAGQGIALCSNIVVADDLASGALVEVLDLAIPGYGFYPVYAFDHPRRTIIEIFVEWISAAAQRTIEARPLSSGAA